MTIPTLTTAPAAPLRSQTPAGFTASAEAFVDWQADFPAEMNAVIAAINALGFSVNSWKPPVRVATTANGALATAFANGQTVDGVTLATGDRILLKDQSTASENGIYVVAASGTPTRATDMAASSDVTGAGIYVIAGSTNGGSLWFNTNTSTPTLGSTSLTFAQFTGGGGSLPAGGATGTVLAKQSATDGDADWIDPGSSFLLENMNRPVGKAYTAKGEYQAIAAATETDILNVSGNNGFVNSIFIAIDDTDYQAREQTVLKVYVDGSGTPVVNCTLARFFAGDYNPPAFKTRFLGFDTATAGGGGQKRSYQCYFPMPFTTGMRITLTAPSGYAISYCWWQVGYNLGDSISWGRMKKFHAVETTNTSLAANSRHTMIDVSSVRGALLGCFLRIDGTSFTFLEGNVRVFVDGEDTAAYESSGMEDYFNHGFYFQSGVLTTDYHGLTKKDAAAFVIGAYRFHVLDPIQFETGLKMDFQNGDTSQQAYTGPSDVAACVWYYTDS